MHTTSEESVAMQICETYLKENGGSVDCFEVNEHSLMACFCNYAVNVTGAWICDGRKQYLGMTLLGALQEAVKDKRKLIH